MFAERLVRLIQPGDVIWVHDYHLIPLALLLRRLGVDNRIGFFLHTPLPGEDLLTCLPRHRELLEAFAAHDLVGFQTEANLRAFMDYSRHEIGAVVADDGRIDACGRSFRAGAFAIGIDVGAIERAARQGQRQAALQRLRDNLGQRQLLIGVDRLDYSKGIAERFAAFKRFLDEHPDKHGQVTLLQITPRSRDDVAEYRQMRARLNRLTGAINGAHATPDWVPIHYLNRSFQHSTLAGYYRLADAALVTPLRDGMNLVAKECVAAQDSDDPGVLVLSRFAGAACELRQALIINPYDPQEVAAGIARALAMSLTERQQRWRDLTASLRDNDINHWRDRFLGQLRQAERPPTRRQVLPLTAHDPH
ncbi:MAG: trehalose-6-phosphate synthase [Xanthomonadales bacterium]|nr:trehalose-6-phosphate synthase [Xanthomonadales bacterium]